MKTQTTNSYLNGNNSSCYRFSSLYGLFEYHKEDFSDHMALITWCSTRMYLDLCIDDFILDGAYESFK